MLSANERWDVCWLVNLINVLKNSRETIHLLLIHIMNISSEMYYFIFSLSLPFISILSIYLGLTPTPLYFSLSLSLVSLSHSVPLTLCLFNMYLLISTTHVCPLSFSLFLFFLLIHFLFLSILRDTPSQTISHCPHDPRQCQRRGMWHRQNES